MKTNKKTEPSGVSEEAYARGSGRYAGTKTRLVVIGNGMAGMRTIEELLKMSPDEFEITVFGAEPQPNYNRILLSPVLSGEIKFADTVLNDWSWYQEHNITLHAGKLVTKIDRLNCVVESEDGLAIPYDRLLIATGSNPIMLPIPGINLPGVLAYRRDRKSVV